jgi:excisionase family DNA binding protein
MSGTGPQHERPSANVWMTRREAAAYVSVSVRTLSRWNLAASRIGRTVRYRREDLDAFLLRHRVEAAGPAPKLSVRPKSSRRPRLPAPPSGSLVDDLIGLLKS